MCTRSGYEGNTGSSPRSTRQVCALASDIACGTHVATARCIRDGKWGYQCVPMNGFTHRTYPNVNWFMQTRRTLFVLLLVPFAVTACETNVTTSRDNSEVPAGNSRHQAMKSDHQTTFDKYTLMTYSYSLNNQIRSTYEFHYHAIYETRVQFSDRTRCYKLKLWRASIIM